MIPPGAADRQFPCLLIGAGTSRFLVVPRVGLPGEPGARAAFLQKLMTGHSSGPNRGGFQDNKVAVVSPGSGGTSLEFHFYQIVQETGEVLDGMECSNAAAAAVLFGDLTGLLRPVVSGHWTSTKNLATGQRVRVGRPAGADRQAHPWRIRFDLAAGVAATMRACARPEKLVLADGSSVMCWIVPHGNVFAFCDLDPADLDGGRAQEIGRLVRVRAQALGRAAGAFLPKVVACPAGRGGELDAASFSDGERHTSLPGSVAMALALFRRLCDPAAAGIDEWRFRYGGPVPGVLEVRLSVVDGRAIYTEFSTPVRLIVQTGVAGGLSP